MSQKITKVTLSTPEGERSVKYRYEIVDGNVLLQILEPFTPSQEMVFKLTLDGTLKLEMANV